MAALKTGQIDCFAELAAKADVINRTLSALLDEKPQIQQNLRQALAYTLKSPGKRLRSALVLWCCELVSGRTNANAQIAAAAIEMVHTYSLVHDDLPAIDDDDLRRGLPTCHKAFGEATAILTGDALLTFAFEVLAKRIDDTDMAVKLIGELACAAGAEGMIAGQMADIKASMTSASSVEPLDAGCSSSIENLRSPKSEGLCEDSARTPNGGESSIEYRVSSIEYIHTNKTAKMFRCAAAMGAITGRATDEQIALLGEYGLRLGLAFQIADDILDVSATSEALGKTAGKDVRQGKATYPALLGLEKSKEIAKKLADQAVETLASFGPEAKLLRKLPLTLLERTR